ADSGDPVAKIYGRVRFSMDGVSKVDAPLPYPLSRVRTRSTLFGVSYADATARGMLILDNAQIEMADED
ncbi:MAG: hypothetical protein K0S65_2883, partial [Labilithrix sp.]|nr:hypothetical protein [Labilithrix sp.]